MSGPSADQLRDDPCPFVFFPPKDGWYPVMRFGPDREAHIASYSARDLTSIASLSMHFARSTEWIARYFPSGSNVTWPDGQHEHDPTGIDWPAFGMWVRDQCRTAETPAPAASSPFSPDVGLRASFIDAPFPDFAEEMARILGTNDFADPPPPTPLRPTSPGDA